MENYFWFTIFVGINALILVALATNISLMRLKHKISYGDGGNKQLLKAIRVHANGVEQVPIFATLLLASIFVEMSQLYIAVLAIVFTISRVLHAMGMLFSLPIFRQLGAGLTYILQGVVAISILVTLSSGQINQCLPT